MKNYGDVNMAAKRNKKKSGRGVLIFLILLCLFALGAGIAFIVDMETVDYYETLTVESGDQWPEAAAFLTDEETYEKDVISYASDIGALQTAVPGNYPVKLALRDKTFSATIVVQDTVAPVGTAKDLTLVNPESLDPRDMVAEFHDVTEVSIRFETEPKLDKSSQQQVTLLLEDQGGNVTRLQANLTVVIDTQAPVIEGVRYLETYVEDAIAYRSGITVTDDQDAAPKLDVDSSAVDLSTPGLYTITYTATDHAGNTTSETATVKVYPKKENHVDPEVIYEAIDKLLAKFIRDDMTTRQKVEAVYCWVQMHTQYSAHSEKDDWLQAGYNFLMTRRGDCYSYFALNKLMLQRLGIPTIDVEKVKNHEGDSRHYWLLVSIDGGETYYHMDNVWSMALCLVTDEHLDKFSAEHDNCFNRDKSLYPATPEEKLPYSALPWNDPVIRGATR